MYFNLNLNKIHTKKLQNMFVPLRVFFCRNYIPNTLHISLSAVIKKAFVRSKTLR